VTDKSCAAQRDDYSPEKGRANTRVLFFVIHKICTLDSSRRFGMSLELVRSVTDDQMKAAALVVLPTDAITNLSSGEIDVLKMRVALCREAAGTAGKALAAAAEHIYEIKKLAKKKSQWMSICKDGLLGMSMNNAERLALAHEKGIFAAVPESCISNVSITTLYLIAKEKNEARKMKALNELAQAAGIGYTEKAARKTLADPTKTKKREAPQSFKEFLSELEKELPAGAKMRVQTIASKAEKVTALEAEIKALKEENEKLKKQLAAAA
jgi:hypothetical protein